jgi:hypothetical protein
MVQGQSASMGNNSTIAGGLGGAAQGAATGAMVGGPVGAVIGGVIGGISGLIGGRKVDKAKKYRQIAAKWQTHGAERQAAIQIRDQVREFRMKRSMAITNAGMEDGGLRSSGPAGGIGSMSAQYSFNRNYAFGQIYIGRQVSRYLQKAGQEMNAANNTFALMDAASSIISTGYDVYKGMKKPSSGGTISVGQAYDSYGDQG